MDVNFVAVILAALSAFFLGFIWYTVVFAKPWQKEIGLGENANTADTLGLGRLLVGSFVFELIMGFIMATMIGTAADAMAGLRVGLMVGVAVASAFGVNYLFEGKTLKHWLINAAYNLTVFAAMGLIIGIL
jgi:hypothetical protein